MSMVGRFAHTLSLSLSAPVLPDSALRTRVCRHLQQHRCCCQINSLVLKIQFSYRVVYATATHPSHHSPLPRSLHHFVVHASIEFFFHSQKKNPLKRSHTIFHNSPFSIAENLILQIVLECLLLPNSPLPSQCARSSTHHFPPLSTFRLVPQQHFAGEHIYQARQNTETLFYMLDGRWGVRCDFERLLSTRLYYIMARASVATESSIPLPSGHALPVIESVLPSISFL